MDKISCVKFYMFVTLNNMKIVKIGIAMLLLLNCIETNAQKVKKKTEKQEDGTKLTYYVFKNPSALKHGSYTVSKNIDRSTVILEKGEYNMGLKVGIWYYYNYNGMLKKEEMYETGKLKQSIESRTADTTTYFYQNDSLIYSKNMGFVYYPVSEKNEQKIYFDDTSKHFRGLKINGLAEGKWYYRLVENTYYEIEYKSGKPIRNNFSLYESGDTFAKFYSENQNNISVFRNQKGVIVTKRIENKGLHKFTTYYGNGAICQEGIMYIHKLISLATFDTTGKPMPYGQITNGAGNYARIAIKNAKPILVDSCNYKDSMLHGFRICLFDKTKTQGIYKNGERDSLEDLEGYMASPTLIVNSFNNIEFHNFFEHFVNSNITETASSLPQFISSFFKMPKIAQELGISGILLIRFEVDEFGNIDKIEPVAPLEKRLGYGLEDDCIRVLKLTQGKWLPAIQFGIVAKSYHRMPIEIDNSSF